MSTQFLNNRELTSLILLGAFGILVVVLGRAQGNLSSLDNSVRQVLKSLISPGISIPLLFYACWIGISVALARVLGLWEMALLKATTLWFVLTGLALVLRLNEAIQEGNFFRKAFLKAIGVLALLEFITALRPFPLWVEVPGQAFAVLFAMVAATRDPKHEAARKMASGYLTMFGLAALAWSIATLPDAWPALDHRKLLLEFLLPIWLTPVALIFVYLFAVYAAYQGAFIRMRIWEKTARLAGQRGAVLLRTHLRLRNLRTLSGLGAQRVARTSGFRDAWREVGRLRSEVEEREREEDSARQRLIDNAGVVGTDEQGRQLDRREFEQTQSALRWLATCEMGHYRTRGERYRDDLLPMVEPHFLHDGLPENHGVELHVAPEGQAWYATRQTITGWWFGIGAAGPPADQWLYDGSAPPRGFPSDPEWDRFGVGDGSKNWD